MGKLTHYVSSKICSGIETELHVEGPDIIVYTVVTPACKLPVFLLHYVIAEKGVGHAIYGEEGRTVCRGIVRG